MSPFDKTARSQLSEQFAELYQMSQDEYRELLTALLDDRVSLAEFTTRVETLSNGLVKLKRVRIQLNAERNELGRID